MSDRKSFLVFKEWKEPVNMLSDEQAGMLFKAMFAYWAEGKNPNFDNDPALKMISSFIFSQFERDKAAYEAKCSVNRENGSKGGRPRKPKETERFLGKPKKAEEDEDKEEDEGEEIIRSTFKPPSVEEVRSYCQQRGNNIDPETFIDYYASRGWMVGKNKMKDWKAAVRNWERRQKAEEPQVEKYHFD